MNLMNEMNENLLSCLLYWLIDTIYLILPYIFGFEVRSSYLCTVKYFIEIIHELINLLLFKQY